MPASKVLVWDFKYTLCFAGEGKALAPFGDTYYGSKDFEPTSFEATAYTPRVSWFRITFNVLKLFNVVCVLGPCEFFDEDQRVLTRVYKYISHAFPDLQDNLFNRAYPPENSGHVKFSKSLIIDYYKKLHKVTADNIFLIDDDYHHENEDSQFIKATDDPEYLFEVIDKTIGLDKALEALNGRLLDAYTTVPQLICFREKLLSFLRPKVEELLFSRKDFCSLLEAVISATSTKFSFPWSPDQKKKTLTLLLREVGQLEHDLSQARAAYLLKRVVSCVLYVRGSNKTPDKQNYSGSALMTTLNEGRFHRWRDLIKQALSLEVLPSLMYSHLKLFSGFTDVELTSKEEKQRVYQGVYS